MDKQEIHYICKTFTLQKIYMNTIYKTHASLRHLWRIFFLLNAISREWDIQQKLISLVVHPVQREEQSWAFQDKKVMHLAEVM